MEKMFVVLGINLMLDLLESDTCMLVVILFRYLSRSKDIIQKICIYITICLYLERIKR
jgi:hypothetical protein